MATLRCRDRVFEDIEAVIFDKDGTLAEVESYLISLGRRRAAHLEALSSGIEADCLSIFGFSEGVLNPAGLLAVGSRYENEIAIAAQLGAAKHDWVSALELVKRAFAKAAAEMAPKVHHTPLMAGAWQLLEQMSLCGIQLAIVSSDTQQEVFNFIEHHRLTAIGWWSGAGPDNLSKNAPSFLEFACQAMDTCAKKTLIVGDSATDWLLACQGAGGFVHMTGGWRCPPQLLYDKEALAFDQAKDFGLPMTDISALSQLEVVD